MKQQIQTKQIPKGWKEEELIEIAEKEKHSIVDGPFGSQMRINEFVSKGIPLIEMQNLRGDKFEYNFRRYITKEKFEEVKRSKIKPNDLIISKTGTLGLLAISPVDLKEAIITSRLAKLSLDKNKIDLTYAYYYLIFLRETGYWQRIAKGTTMKILTTKQLKSTKVTYPESKEEQILIVQEIEKQFTRLDASVKSLKSVKKKLEVYRKAVLKKAFEGLPSKPLQDFCDDVKKDIVDGPFGSDLQRKDYSDRGIPVLKIQNVKPFKILLKKMDYISTEKYEQLKRHSFKPGDIIMTKLGDPLGVSAIVADKLSRGVIVADLVRIRTKLKNQYLCYALNSSIISQFINSKQKGTTRPRVKLSIVRELPIPYTSESEQTQIVQEIESKFSVIDKIEQVVNESLEKSEKLRKSILKSAFEGKLVKISE